MTLTIPFLPAMLVIGGICIFLIGLDISKRAFRKAVGEGMSRFMYKISQNGLLSFLFGIGLSAISQSSTAASSFSVGLVDIGMLSLESAILVTMGASIGTAFVTLLISLDLVICAPLILAASTITARLGRGNLSKAAKLLEGISLLLTGMLILKVGIEPLLSQGLIRHVLLEASRTPLYLGAASFVLVSVIQSSPAVMAIAIALASSGLLPLSSLVAVVLGSHLGSSSMVLMASMGARVNARRLALSNFIFRLAGVTAFIPFSGYVTDLVSSMVSSMSPQVALIHITVTSFNVLVGLPFFHVLAEFARTLIIPSRDEEIGEPAFISPSMQEFPVMAMNLLAKEMIRLGSFSEELFVLLLENENMQEKLPYLKTGISRLQKECVRFFSGIQPPGPDDYWKNEYSCLSSSLAAMEDLTNTLSHNMYLLLDKDRNILFPGSLLAQDISEISKIMLRLMSQSVGAFALGGKEMSRTAKKTWSRYLQKDKSIRTELLANKAGIQPGEYLRIWKFLTIGNRIARASFELARGALVERSPDAPCSPKQSLPEKGGK